MKEFNYAEFISCVPIEKRETIDVVSDLLSIGMYCKRRKIKFDPNELIDCFCDAVGPEGNVLIRTFSHDFCNKKKWSYKETRSGVGALGNVALKRSDFVRTRHPIFSWMVYGRDRDYLCGLDNQDSFSFDSVFGWEYNIGANLITIGSPMSEGFTFIHYVEQKVGVPYRHKENFSGEYIDEDGNSERRTYSMYTRNNEKYEIGKFDFDKIFPVLRLKGIQSYGSYHGIELKKTNLTETANLLEEDIINNGEFMPTYKVR